MENQPLLQFHDVTKRYSGRAVLRRVNFAVRRGEAVAVVGANGSGKSTLLRIASGLVAVDEGKVEHPGTPAPNIGYAPDRLPKLRMSSTEYLQHMGRIQGIPREKLLSRIAELHERFQLPAGPARLTEYSKGMLQKVNLMQSLIGEPDLLLLDEPFSGLDDRSQRELFIVLEGVKRDGVSIVAATHEPELTVRLAVRCITLRDGELSAAEPESAAPACRRIVCKASVRTLNALGEADGVLQTELAAGRGRYLVRAEDADRFLLKALQAGASVESVTAG